MKACTRIEYPSCGESYHRPEFGVYRYDEFPRYSVLAGQRRRQYLGTYATEAEARAAHPEAIKGVHDCGWAPVSLNHLPGDDDPDPLGDDRDAYNEGMREGR